MPALSSSSSPSSLSSSPSPTSSHTQSHANSNSPFAEEESAGAGARTGAGARGAERGAESPRNTASPPSPPPPVAQFVSPRRKMLAPLAALTMVTLGSFCKFFIKVRHKTKVTGVENLNAAIKKARKEKRGLITISNHTCPLDDPMLWAATQSVAKFTQPNKMRWTIGAHDICFKSKMHTFFFNLVQTLPVERFGAGPDQPGIDTAIGLLNEGKWVHIYPEGYVHQPQGDYLQTMRYFKWGVSRMVLESKKRPIVLPIYTQGLQNVFPEEKLDIKSPKFKRHQINYFIGEAISSDLDYFRAEEDRDSARNRSEIAKFLNLKLLELKARYVPLKPMEHELVHPEFWGAECTVPILGLSPAEKRQKASLLST